MTVEMNKMIPPVELILCFWGSFWNTDMVKFSSNLVYKNTIREILGDQENERGITHKHGLKKGSLVYIEIYDSTEPKEELAHFEVEAMLAERMNSSEMPAPIVGQERLYAVVFPPGNYQKLQVRGEASKNFMYHGIGATYICLDHTGSLMMRDTAPE